MNLIAFFKEVKNELKYIKWPSRKLVIISTFAVIIISTLVAVYLDTIDIFLRKILQIILK